MIGDPGMGLVIVSVFYDRGSRYGIGYRQRIRVGDRYCWPSLFQLSG